MEKSKFVYRGDKRTVESVARKSKQSGGIFDSYLSSEVQVFKPKDGENVVRIMPPSWPEKDDEKWGDGWDIQIFLHYSVGPDNATYLCLDKMRGEKCPVCEARRGATDKERDQIKPQGRWLCWVIDRDNEKAGPQVWSMPVTVFREINLRSVDKKHNTPIPIDDPEEGYDFAFSIEKQKIKLPDGREVMVPKYSGFEVLRDANPLHDDEKLQNRWLDYITEHQLPNILQFYDADYIENVLFGKTERGSADDVEERAPMSRRRGSDEDPDRGSSKRASRHGGSDDEADYLDEDDGVVESDGEAEPGRSGGGRRRSRSAEEDDDDVPFEGSRRTSGRRTASKDEAEEPDEEDDVDERPARGGRAKPTSRTRGAKPAEDEEFDIEEEVVDPSTGARAKLEEMKRRRSRR